MFVYTDQDIEELKKIEEVYDILSDDMKVQKKEDDDCGIEFTFNVDATSDSENTKEENEEKTKKYKKEVNVNKDFKIGDATIEWDEI